MLLHMQIRRYFDKICDKFIYTSVQGIIIPWSVQSESGYKLFLAGNQISNGNFGR